MIAFGDSLAAGIGAAAGAVNLGVVGWGLYHHDVPARLDALHDISKSGDNVLISVGTNDTPGPDYEQRLVALRMSVSPLSRVTWLAPPTGCWGRKTVAAEKITPIINAIADRYGDRIIDANSCDHRLRADDGLHFTPRGYDLIADAAKESFAP